MAEEIEIPVLIKEPKTPDGTLSGIGRFSRHFGRLFGAIKSHPYVLAALAIGYAAVKLVTAWGRQERAVNQLNQSLVQQGIYTRQLSESYQQMASSIQLNTAFGDEEVIEAQASMQAYLGQQAISERLMRAVADFAANRGMPLATAADLVGRSIGTSTNGLARYGIVIDQSLSGSAKQEAILSALEERWGGQAEAHAKGLGAITQMGNALGDLLEVFGRSLSPFVVAIAQSVTGFARTLSASRRFLDGIAIALEGTSIALDIVKTSLAALAEAIPALISSRMKVFGQLLRGKFLTAADSYIRGNLEAGEIIRSHAMNALARAKSRDTLQLSAHKAKEEEGINLLIESEENARRNREKEGKQQEEFLRARSQKEIIEQHAMHILKEDHVFRAINLKLKHEKDRTALLQLELEKRKRKEEAIREASVRFAKANALLGKYSDKEQMATMKKGLDYLADLRDSKFGVQVAIGKAAAIAKIGLDTTASVLQAPLAFAEVPPPVGPAMATAIAGFLTAYGAEQVANIVGVDLWNHGRIGGLEFNLPNLLTSIWTYLGEQNAMIAQVVGEVLGFTGDLVSSAGRAIADVLGSLGPIGEAIGAVVQVTGDIVGAAYKLVGEVYAKVYRIIADVTRMVAQAIADVVTAVVNAVADAISSVFDALFGWLFAEGGMVTHTAGGSPVVTPLADSGLQFHSTVNVTIRGGLVPSPREAQRIARLISAEMRR